MRLEWIEDILAVVEYGSLDAACKKRNVSQPAFSRRIRKIEQSLGATLFDRSARPARLAPHIPDQIDRMRELSAGLRDLALALSDTHRTRRKRVVIVTQHAIATTSTPEIIGRYADLDCETRLRSANRDECIAQIMTRRADIALIYDVTGTHEIRGADFLDIVHIGTETLIPVFSGDWLEKLNQQFLRGELPVIAYPSDVFLGQIQRRIIFPRLTKVGSIRTRLETALTLAALEFARAGMGVAWIPEHLARVDIQHNRLLDLSSTLPAISMQILAARVIGGDSSMADAVWKRVCAIAPSELAPSQNDNQRM